MTLYEPFKIESEVLQFWQKNKIYEKAKKKTAKGQKFYFLDGPPFPSGETHPGTAANKVAKDALIRYKRMRGFNVWDRPGWDMHGLPIEKKVEKELGLKSKAEIEKKVGIQKFINACKAFATKYMGVMERDFERLGVWMPWREAYLTLDPIYMESVWYGIKRAHERGLLYKGKKTLYWCPHCETSLAKNELEYKSVSDLSLYLKFKLIGKKDEYLIVWTTTPWTVAYNLGVMVNPKEDYVKVSVNGENWWLAKALASSVLGYVGKKYKILETKKGAALEGLEYEHPFDEDVPEIKVMKAKNPKINTVVLSEQFVSVTDGTGLVHMAPGCGPEDFEVGQQYGLPAWNEANEAGFFTEKMGKLAGLRAKYDDDKFIDMLERKGAVVYKSKIEHDYAHCWRCHAPIIYRATEQWFIAISKIKDKILKEIEKLYTVPELAKQIFIDWITNFQDWCVTIQRYWNTPFPVWTCNSCGQYEVIGTISELEKRSKKRVKDLHRSFVDSLTWKCQKCSGEMRRVPDVLSVWFDSGAASWASLNYPNTDKLYKKFFPADFILEGRDQIRAWFSALMNFSMAAFERPAFNALYWHGFFNDEQGRKMSKSFGNFITVQDGIAMFGSEPFRLRLIEWCMPGNDARINKKDIEDCFKAINVLWNMHNLLIESCNLAKFNPLNYKFQKLSVEDRWILSRLNSLILQVTTLFDKYRISEIPNILKVFWLEDLSRSYIHLVRDRLAEGDSDALAVFYHTYMQLLRLCSPLLPLTTEAIFQNLKHTFKLKEESVHLLDWPAADQKQIDSKLELEISYVKDVLSNILALREKMRRGIKWPVKTVTIITENEELASAIEEHTNLIKRFANVFDVSVSHELKGIRHKVKADFSRIGPKFQRDAAEVVAAIARASPESILKNLQKNGKIKLEVKGKEIELQHDDVIIEEVLPKGLIGGMFGSYSLYLDTEETEEMLQNGFVREFTRAVQSLRKKASLQKPDKIILFISAPEKSKEALEQRVKEIGRKVGAKEVNFVAAKVVEACKHHDKIVARSFEAKFGF
ncbi:MAG: isoleucine--tRNA ligase [Candidatus Nanoarchaeia archaeon]